MTENTHATVLRRMARARDHDVADNPLTSSRAVRLVLTKAANDTVGLSLTVSSVAEDTLGLDELLETLPDGMMLVGLHRQDVLLGVVALDMQLRAAVLEMQTMGVVTPRLAEDRIATQTDLSLCQPLLTAFLTAFPAAVQGTSFDGWGNDVTLGHPIDTKRAAGLLLDDVRYRLVQLNVDLGGPDRKGFILMALPLTAEIERAAPVIDPPVPWHAAFETSVGAAPATLTAVLHRFAVSLAAAQDFQIGTVLPLHGCTLGSVRLTAPDGQLVATARLGQSGGKRAVKLQPAPETDLHDLATPKPADQPTTDSPETAMLTTSQTIDGNVTKDGFGQVPDTGTEPPLAGADLT